MALLAYPLVIEPTLGLSLQSRLWRSGFLVLAILVLDLWTTARRAVPANGAPSRGIRRNERCRQASLARWLVLVFITSSWLMGVTTYLTTDLAAIPLLWVIPLIDLPVELHSRVCPFGGSSRFA